MCTCAVGSNVTQKYWIYCAHAVKLVYVHGVEIVGIWGAELGETRTETAKPRSLEEKQRQNWGHTALMSNLAMTQVAKNTH